MRTATVVLLGVGLAVLARMCVFTVDRTEFVYLTQFGHHVATFDGADDDQAGLHFRWPWPIQTVTRVDRRQQQFDLPPAELVTADPREQGTIDKTLVIDGYVVWRVPDAAAAERFIMTLGTPEKAREILRDRFRSQLGAVIPRMPLEHLLNTDGRVVDAHREELRQLLLRPYRNTGPAYGIEVVDVQVRRLIYPAKVNPAILDRIKSERQRKVELELSKGRAEASDILSAADAEIKILQEKSRAALREARGIADAQADRIENQAIRKDPDYYAELKRRELGETALDGRKRVWSTRLFELFFPYLDGAHPPRMAPMPKEGGR